MSEKGSYAPPPNMEAPKVDGFKSGASSSYPTHQGYPPQQNINFGGYPSSTASPQDQYVPNPDTDPIVKGFEFSTESIRRGFIRKVYSILSLQLMVTLGLVLLFVYHDGTQQFAAKNFWLAIVAIIVGFATIIVLCCCEGVRRQSPHNIIILAVFTVAESISVAYCTLGFDKEIVMLAVLVTAVIVISLTIFAFQTKWDFTMMGGVLFCSLWLMIMVGFVMMFWRSHVADMIYCSFGALLFCAYLIYDTQMIIGGNHKFQMSPEEYILGAIALFLDIINIFLYVLRILAASSKS